MRPVAMVWRDGGLSGVPISAAARLNRGLGGPLPAGSHSSIEALSRSTEIEAAARLSSLSIRACRSMCAFRSAASDTHVAAMFKHGLVFGRARSVGHRTAFGGAGAILFHFFHWDFVSVPRPAQTQRHGLMPTEPEDEVTWLRHRVVRMRTILRFVKEPLAEAGSARAYHRRRSPTARAGSKAVPGHEEMTPRGLATGRYPNRMVRTESFPLVLSTPAFPPLPLNAWCRHTRQR
jgi:hypothetical protein